MKWHLEISDCPENAAYPILAYQVNDSGVKRGPFYLSVESIIEGLQKKPGNLLDANGMRSEEKSTPSLPFGTIRYSTNEHKTRERVTMEIAKKQWEIRYGDEEEIHTIGFPRMVVQYLVVESEIKKKISEMRIYAVEDNKKHINDATPLYTFPFPNVGKSNAIVCWGQNQRVEIASLVELERAFLWFVSAPFNEDHGVETTLGIPNFKKLIKSIEDKPFDDELLVPQKQTFGDLFKTY
jgi:Prokaryotic E2 family D